MKKIMLMFFAVMCSNAVLAKTPSCSDGVGFWMGTYHIKDADTKCPKGFDVACKRGASIAIALKKASDKYHYTAELFPQFGDGGTLNLYCSNGQIEVVDDRIPAELLPKISLQCDEVNNCSVHYDDMNLQASLGRQWVWESYAE